MNKKEKKVILIVDDEAINIMALAQILKPEYDVIVAIDGDAAIEAAKKHLPNIILLDVIMPGVSGFDVLVRLRNYEYTKDIPVIFITGLDSAEDEETGFFLGAVDYITKPFHDSIVKARVKTHLRLAEYIHTIEQLSKIDTLTQLPNRRGFDNQIEKEWRHALNDKIPISLLMIDIDRFKIYNDTYGHPQGDLLLQILADTLKDSMKREVDFVARWGGEEFTILLPDADLKEALITAEQVRKNVEETRVIFSDGTSACVTISIGVNSVIPFEEDTMENFINVADKALYKAKNSGRNKVCTNE